MTPERRGGCPRCRQDLVRRLRRDRFSPPDFPQAPASARHWGADVALYIGIASAAASLIAGGIGAYASYASSRAQAGAMEYNAILAQQQGMYQSQLAQQMQAQAFAQAEAQAGYMTQLGEFEAGMLERQARGTATMAEAEMLLAEQQAAAARAAGGIREAGITRAYDRTQSEVRAAIGKSGVDTTGSPLLVLQENADTVGMELAINDYQTALDVAGATASGSFALAEGKMRADSLRQEAVLRRFGSQVSAAGARMGAVGVGSNYLASAQSAFSQASMLGMQAGGIRQAGMFGIGTSLLGGVQGAISPWLRYGRTA